MEVAFFVLEGVAFVTKAAASAASEAAK